MLFVFVAEEFDQLLRTGCQVFYLRVRVPQTKGARSRRLGISTRILGLQPISSHSEEEPRTRQKSPVVQLCCSIWLFTWLSQNKQEILLKRLERFFFRQAKSKWVRSKSVAEIDIKYGALKRMLLIETMHFQISR